MPRKRQSSSVLDQFLPPVRQWFRQTLGKPTLPQQQGWPAIASGKNTLILAPTGSGKTLAAFLACLDYLWRQDDLEDGVQVLYISPLKALNNDIQRNLQSPLIGVRAVAEKTGFILPEVRSAVRTGDTPTSERQRMLRKPPQILITTPESLHLLLTSKARKILSSVRFCIVDEIHALCTNKRGVFLSLLLERLTEINDHNIVRIGLSATQRPLDEVAKYLGGRTVDKKGRLVPRPVTIVDAGLRKEIDLSVHATVDHFDALPEGTVWPSIYRYLTDEIRKHQSTIVFANDRRAVERITTQVNELQSQLDALCGESESELLAMAHHGSVSLEMRQETEKSLKEGRLPAVIATASLEMGIDMGAVELVAQVASPGNIARGLQRVGRAGHLVGQKSKGVLIPRTMADLLEQTVLAREMLAGNVEECHVPVNCLDILAQQIVAIVAMDVWSVPDLFAMLRRAYPFRDLTPETLDTVLEMITGRYQFKNGEEINGSVASGQTLRALNPRISWDRTHNQLLPLPGTQHLALLNGGTIPDTGQFIAVTKTGNRIGELDEEFIFERREGESFLLGTNTWYIDKIETDRIIVSPGKASAHAVLPFWRGEGAGRSYELGLAIAKFLREVKGHLDSDDCLSWLQDHFPLDDNSAKNLRWHLRKQWQRTGCLPSDRVLYVEASRDHLGDWQVLLLSPFGRQVNLGLRLAIEGQLRKRLGYRPQCLHHDDGILFRLTDSEIPVLDLFQGINAKNIQQLIMTELIDSPLFAIRFRQNAARAMLMPGGGAGKRSPLWLQRLRSRDLLQVARSHADFPIVMETYRECLQEYLHLPRIMKLFEAIDAGDITITSRELDEPSPFGSALLFVFHANNMYQYDGVEPTTTGAMGLDQEKLRQIMPTDQANSAISSQAIAQVEQRLRGNGLIPRSPAEMAEWLRRYGDLATSELQEEMADLLAELQTQDRVSLFSLPKYGKRWILTEELELYQLAFPKKGKGDAKSRETILQRFLDNHALVSLDDLVQRYPLDRDWTEELLQKWSKAGRMVSLPVDEKDTLVFSSQHNFQRLQKATLREARQSGPTVSPATFADFLVRWHGLSPTDTKSLSVSDVIDQLQGLVLPADLWEQVIFPGRVANYGTHLLDQALSTGEFVWYCAGQQDNGPGDVGFLPREALRYCQSPTQNLERLTENARRVQECLQARGALYVVEIAPMTGLLPGQVRTVLWQLARQSLVTNDRYDPIRAGESKTFTDAGSPQLRRRGVRRTAMTPEGRWSLIPWQNPSPENHALQAAQYLLRRHGIVTKEMAQMDPSMPAWRHLFEIFDKMELAGDVKRGYFVEGLHGVQFALPEALTMLGQPALQVPPLLLHSLDPANIHGSGAPFEINSASGKTRAFVRRNGSWLVQRNGSPILLIEQDGKRLTTLGHGSDNDLTASLAALPDLLKRDRALASKRKLTINEWNGEPVTASEAVAFLENLGFVRDYRSMTLYGSWR